MKRIYIAGSITKNPDYKKQFCNAEKILLSKGYVVFNPAKNKANSYKEYIDIGLRQLQQCDAIYLLSNYKESNGALLEFKYAKTVGIEIIKEERTSKCSFTC